MGHFFVVVSIISLNCGLITLIVMIVLNLKTNNAVAWKYIIILVLNCLLLLLYSVDVYNQINLNYSSYALDIIITFTGSIMFAMINFFLPYFFYSLFGIKFSIWKKILHSGISMLSIISIFLLFIKNDVLSGLVRYQGINSFIFIVLFFYYMIMLLINFKTIRLFVKHNMYNDSFLLVLIKVFLVVNIVLFPLVIMVHSLHLASFHLANCIVFSLHFLIWNIFNIASIIRLLTLIKLKQNKVITDVSDDYINKFHITEREKEIIILIIQGESNKTISSILNCSKRTVDNHIYNIFKKTKSVSRVDLIHKIGKRY